MKKIFKYPITLNSYKDDTFLSSFEAPAGCRVISVALQNSRPTIWFECEDTNPIETQYVHVFGTGYGALPNLPLRFIGTVFIRAEVYHVYQEGL